MSLLFTMGSNIELSLTSAAPLLPQKARPIENFDLTTDSTGTKDITITDGLNKQINSISWRGDTRTLPQSVPAAEIIDATTLRVYSNLGAFDPNRNFSVSIILKVS